MGFLQVDTVTDNVSGHILVGSAWVPVGLTTASEFATGLSQSLLFQRKGERGGEGRLVGTDHRLLPVPLPVPVTLNTLFASQPCQLSRQQALSLGKTT